ncbi:MAG: DUF3572 domain-containing protein [Rhodobacteraceae bacterium]|nr:DUF3572 domain-containing protein [Paracoccaceae bacterium]
MAMNRENAETLALEALAWIAGNDELLPVFLGATGADRDALRAGAGDPGFLGSVLDFLLMDDAWIVAFCDAAGLSYEAPLSARAALPGANLADWA